MTIESKGTQPARDTLISKDENQAMFDTIAKRYDLMNRIISLGLDGSWRKQTLRALGIKPDGRYLDIGAGTGDLALGIAKKEATALVVGLDPSGGMLSIGRKKAQNKGCQDRIAFTVGDAMALPFNENTFDGVVLGFCIRNVEDRNLALKEMQRVLKPGGRLAILELTTPENRVAGLLHKIHTTTVLPAAARMLSLSSAYTYLVKSVQAFPSASEFTKQISAAGFLEAQYKGLTLGTVTVFSGTKNILQF